MDWDRRIHRLTLQYRQPRDCSEITWLSHEDLCSTCLNRCTGRDLCTQRVFVFNLFLSRVGLLSMDAPTYVFLYCYSMTMNLHSSTSPLFTKDFLFRHFQPVWRLSNHKDVSRTSPGHWTYSSIYYTITECIREGFGQYTLFPHPIMWQYNS